MRDRVVLDFSQRLKASERLRTGLLEPLSRAFTNWGAEAIALIPDDTTGDRQVRGARVLPVGAHSDLLFEEVQLPALLRRLGATVVVTFRENFRSKACHVHLHLHEDPRDRAR